MMRFGKKDNQGYYHSECGRYVLWLVDRNAPKENRKRWGAARWLASGEPGEPLVLHADFDDALFACDDDANLYPCGCVLRNRERWWVFCPKCGDQLPDPKPIVVTPPKPKRKVKEPHRPAWLVDQTRGIEHGENWDCVYDGKHWALVRIPGYTGWVSVGEQAYHPISWSIRRKDSRKFGMHIQWQETNKVERILDIGRFRKDPKSFSAVDVYEGRVTVQMLVRFKKLVDGLDEDSP